MPDNLTGRREEIDSIFCRVLPMIDSALVRHYRLSQDEAMGVEQSLYEWFHGFARRPGSPKSAEGLRPHLLLMACQAGHVYWTGKVVEESQRDESVKRSLVLGPQEIAIEVETTVKRRETAPAVKSTYSGDGNGEKHDS
jgi:hypothetical protein